MHARKHAEAANVPAAAPVAIGRDAANDGAKPAEALVPQRSTLDQLVARYGPPSPFEARMAFAGYDPSAGLLQGQQVATERILRAVPVFVQGIVAAWDAMTPARRARVVGYAPSMLGVVLAETVALRDLDARYDRAAKRSSRSRARCEALAKGALRDARDLRDQSVRLMRRHVPAAQQTELSLDRADEAAESPAAVALTTESAADAMSAWRDGAQPEARAYHESLGFTEGFAASLRAAAARVRGTQAELDAVANVNHVTQRQLDEQDGRVLHLVGAIHLAFKLAAKRDPGIATPALDAVERVFVRAAPARKPPPAAKPAPTPA